MDDSLSEAQVNHLLSLSLLLTEVERTLSLTVRKTTIPSIPLSVPLPSMVTVAHSFIPPKLFLTHFPSSSSSSPVPSPFLPLSLCSCMFACSKEEIGAAARLLEHAVRNAEGTVHKKKLASPSLFLTPFSLTHASNSSGPLSLLLNPFVKAVQSDEIDSRK
jgi:hypothetical protein